MKIVLTMVYIGIIVLVVALAIAGTIIMLNNVFAHNLMEPLYATTFFILSVLYCVTLIFMLGTLNNLNQVGLKDERKSIVKQFGFFLLAFLTRTFYYFIVFLIHDADIFDIDHREIHFYMMFT